MRFVQTLFIVVLLGCLLGGGAGAALATPNPGACYVSAAEKDRRAAKRALVRAEKRYREASHVARATRYYSTHDYSDFAWRHVEPVPVGRWVRLARRVGWPWPCIDQLMHIIARESSGYPGVVNPSSGCTGLLQILPSNVSQPERLSDPKYNLRSGLKLYRAAGWSPWIL
jgi:hypothetical protein